MATTPRSKAARAIEYPTSDGRPMAETDFHRDLMFDLIDTLQVRHEAEADVYVSGNILVFYEEGNRRRHLAPDVLFVRGAPKRQRLYYLIWEEPKGLDVVIELTSRTTKSEDVKKKFDLYRDVLRVPEYFLFDPFEEYLRPSMRGYRLVGGEYERIEPVEGRLGSELLGVDLVRDGRELRLIDRATGLRLANSRERFEGEQRRAEAERVRAEAEHARAEGEHLRAEGERARADGERVRADGERVRAERAEAENDRLRREIEALRGGGR